MTGVQTCALPILEALIDELGKLRTALTNNDGVELKTMLKRAKHYRDELRFRV